MSSTCSEDEACAVTSMAASDSDRMDVSEAEGSSSRAPSPRPTVVQELMSSTQHVTPSSGSSTEASLTHAYSLTHRDSRRRKTRSTMVILSSPASSPQRSRLKTTSANLLNVRASDRGGAARLPSPTSSRTSSPQAIDPLRRSPEACTAAAELSLLSSVSSLDRDVDFEDHEYKTAPVMTREAYLRAHADSVASQYGVLGSLKAIVDNGGRAEAPADPRLYFNTNAPLSALICGVQGSGKSHTLSVLLENMLIPNHAAIGNGTKALSGLVLHFGEGGAGARPSETAWLACAAARGVQTPRVRVYVSRSSLHTMRRVYAPLGDRVAVEPLLFSESELDAQAFLAMMAVGSSEGAPLYVQIILSILRDMGENFSYSALLRKLVVERDKFNPAQKAGMEQRMALMQAFVDTNARQDQGRFAEGQLTIIDLSDPFLDPAAACGLFEIVTRMFVRADVGTGKVLVVDEAHKYLACNRGSFGLTNALLSLIRQQRHMAMRVLISTQEPTVVPPVLIDLCSVAIMHRFSSPAWWDHVAKHVSASLSDEAFDQIVKLKTGEAIVLAPSGLALLARNDDGRRGGQRLAQFGRRYLVVKTRQRVTLDGGASLLVLDE